MLGLKFANGVTGAKLSEIHRILRIAIWVGFQCFNLLPQRFVTHLRSSVSARRADRRTDRRMWKSRRPFTHILRKVVGY
jgi:hypothetical protein